MPRGVWGLWVDVPEPTRTELRTIYRDLRAEYGLPTRRARRYAKQVCELWLVTDRLSEQAARLVGQRKMARATRSTRRLVNGVVKRQGLELYSLDQARQQLAAMVGRNARNGNGHHADDLAARILALPTAATKAGP